MVLSREEAVWALTEFGIHCLVAPSFGEIFAGNPPKTGLLTIALAEKPVSRLDKAAARVRLAQSPC